MTVGANAGGTAGGRRIDRATWLQVLVCLGLALPAAVLAAKSMPSEAPTLQKSGKWVLGKQFIDQDFMGVARYLNDSQTLAGGRLDLSAWHGFQEVLARPFISPERIAFDFMLSKDSYFSVVFNKSRDIYSGFCISIYPHVGTKYFEADFDGRFLRQQAFHMPGLDAGSWHRCSVEFSKQDATLTIDGTAVTSAVVDRAANRRVGFRGSGLPVYIDNVRIAGTDGQQFEDTFDGQTWPRLVPPLYAALIALSGVSTLVLVKLLPRNREALSWVISGLLCLNAGLGTKFGFDTFVGDALYPAVSEEMIEREQAYVSQSYDEIARHVAAQHELTPLPGIRRVLFVGTSQTFGAGADEAADRIPEQVKKHLAAARPDQEIEVINGAVPGAKLALLVNFYQSFLTLYRPDTLVINLGLNDSGAHSSLHSAEERERYLADFEANMIKFCELARSQGSEVLISLEAHCAQVHDEHHEIHQRMRAVANALNLPLVDSHDYMRQRQDAGLLWWDVVHPSSAGMEMIAAVIAQELNQMWSASASEATQSGTRWEAP